MKQSQQTNPIKPSQSSASDSKKFLTHFQSINTPMKAPPAFITQQNRSSSKNKYNTTLQLYASSISIIDKIADSPIKQSKVSYSSAQKNDIVATPMIVNLNPRIKERVVSINNFFNPDKNQELELYHHQEDGNLNTYIQNIIGIDINNTLVRQQEQQHRSRSKSTSKGKEETGILKTTQRRLSTPPHQPPHQPPQQIVHQKQHVQEAQVNTDPIFPTQRSPAKLKKMDLLLVEIMREKKRKGLVPDYFRAIQMKLVQMLEYILHDQPDYFGLSLVEKMKEVLKNLENFKGKTIDGQSKVNMLRIFFEQFRNLKKQRQQDQQGRQNKSRSHSKKSASKGQSKKSGGNQMGPPLISRSKKNFDTFSVGGTRSQGKPGPNKNVSTKSVKQEDQWIGSLDN